MTDLTIDWTEAMEQVGGDEEFLKEVLQDLLKEADAAEIEMLEAIKKENFDEIMRSSHRIKGSASYLCCNALKEISQQLQFLGREGISNPSSNLLESIQKAYDIYVTNLKNLRLEIETKYPPTE